MGKQVEHDRENIDGRVTEIFSEERLVQKGTLHVEGSMAMEQHLGKQVPIGYIQDGIVYKVRDGIPLPVAKIDENYRESDSD